MIYIKFKIGQDLLMVTKIRVVIISRSGILTVKGHEGGLDWCWKCSMLLSWC